MKNEEIKTKRKKMLRTANSRYTKRLLTGILLLCLLCFSGCTGKPRIDADGYFNPGNLTSEQVQLPKKGEEIAVITTSKGIIKMRLFEKVAPKAVANFMALSRKGYYEGLKFDVIVQDLKIQVEPPADFDYEKATNEEAVAIETDLDYRFYDGCVGIAKNKGNQIMSCFYIICQDEIDPEYFEMMQEMEDIFSEEVLKTYKALGGIPRSDMDYTIFGQVFYGLDLVKTINSVEVTGDKPIDPVVIKKIEIVPFEGR